MKITRDHLRFLHQKIPHQKRQGPRGIMLDYIDSRQVMGLLDAVVGPENWSDSYVEISGSLFCKISIKVDGQWISKMDCGSESAIESEKGQASDAFKRAAVKWGIGRFLYPKTDPQKAYKYKVHIDPKPEIIQE